MLHNDSDSLKIRLFIDTSFAAARRLEVSESQAHYLIHVMRLPNASRVAVFNGRDGEWSAVMERSGKRGCFLTLTSAVRAQTHVPDLWLLFAPVKRAALAYLVQKATELGISRLQPIRTARTIVTRVNEDRLRANMIEAAEQSDRLCVPELGPYEDLGAVLDGWDPERKVIYCDESGDDATATWGGASGRADELSTVLAQEKPGPWGILLGPEGGFSPTERQYLRSLSYIVPVSLGPRIMRADTAAIAALSVWQSVLGDWRA